MNYCVTYRKGNSGSFFYTIKIKLQLNIENACENHVIILRGNPFKAIECCIWPIRDGDEKKKIISIVGLQTFYRVIVTLDLNLLDFNQSNLANETTLFVAMQAHMFVPAISLFLVLILSLFVVS